MLLKLPDLNLTIPHRSLQHLDLLSLTLHTTLLLLQRFRQCADLVVKLVVVLHQNIRDPRYGLYLAFSMVYLLNGKL